MNTTLALCIPAYNASGHLSDLFASVRYQEIPFDEILLYDDCSTDNTAEIAKRLGATVIRGAKNCGCSNAKNVLAQHAKSDWIFFLDSDDELLADFSSKVRNEIEKAVELDLILLGYKYVDKPTGQIKSEVIYDKQCLLDDPLKFMIDNKVVNSSVVKRTSFNSIGGFNVNPTILHVEDRAYSIKTAMNGFKYQAITSVCFQINFNPDSMSAKNPRLWLSAGINLWKNVHKSTNGSYDDSICNQLFLNGVWAAKFGFWDLTKESLDLAKQINSNRKPSGGVLFQLLYAVHPLIAYKIRQRLLNFLNKKID